MKETPRADGSCSYVAFCEVKSVDQLTAIIEMASKQVAEEQEAMTRTVVVFNEKDEELVSENFVKESDIDYPDTCPDYVKNSKLGSTAVALLDYTSFLQSGVKALKVVIIAVGGGLAVLGVVNLLEGYGNDNPEAKSQGMK